MLVCIYVCKNVSVSVHALMRVSVFIDIANGFSAGPKFVCSVTQYGSWFIRQAFRIEAWLMTLSDTTVNDLTPISSNRGEREGGGGIRGGIVIINRPSRQDDILTWRVGKEKSLNGRKKGRKMKSNTERERMGRGKKGTFTLKPTTDLDKRTHKQTSFFFYDLVWSADTQMSRRAADRALLTQAR